MSEVERPLSEMSNEEIETYIQALQERRKNVSLRRIEERAEKVNEKKEVSRTKKDTFAKGDPMNALLDDILGDL